MDIEMKLCSCCNMVKPLSEFRTRDRKNGETYCINQCKKCEKERYSFTCEICGKQFKDKHKNRRYCSKECTNKSFDRKISYNCENCGKLVSVKPYTYNKSEHHYCSDNCTREHRPTWFNGEKIYNYDPKRSNELRKSQRKSQEDSIFINGVKKRDNYTCQCCDNRGGKLVSHHLESYNSNVEGRYNIDNGITLCEECHKKFHKQYGYGNNTTEQYKKFEQSEKSGCYFYA